MARHLGKISGFQYIYDVATLSFVPWDGSLTAGSVVIGAVTQSGTWNVNVTKTALTPSSPTFATVSTASGQIAAAGNRKGLIVVNESNVRVYLGMGAPAVVGRGVALMPSGGSFTMGEYDYSTGAINAISTSSSNNITVQEFT